MNATRGGNQKTLWGRIREGLPVTLTGWVNFLVFQFFFVRRVRIYKISKETGAETLMCRGWDFGIWPLTGWWSGYKRVR